MTKHQPLSLTELKQGSKSIRNIAIEHRERLSYLEKFAVWITERVGSLGFFLILFVWTFGWLLWNTLAPKAMRFDPFPAFVLWLFISNLMQLLFLPLLMLGQNLQGRYSEARAEADFEINVKAEKEIETILMHLENQNELILEILKRLDKEK